MLGKRIRELRGARGLTVREFAEKLGKSAAYVSKIEARNEIPSPELLCMIAELLDTDGEGLLRLAKKAQLERTAKDIDEKQASAIALFRKQKR